MIDELMPGADDFTDPPFRYDPQGIVDAISEAEVIGTQLQDKLRGQVSQSLTDVAQHAIPLEANLAGSAGHFIDKAANLMQKPQQKILTSLRHNLGESYGLMSSLGLPIPTMEQVEYGLNTGDITGSLGFGLPGVAGQGQSGQQFDGPVFPPNYGDNGEVSPDTEPPDHGEVIPPTDIVRDDPIFPPGGGTINTEI